MLRFIPAWQKQNLTLLTLSFFIFGLADFTIHLVKDRFYKLLSTNDSNTIDKEVIKK